MQVHGQPQVPVWIPLLDEGGGMRSNKKAQGVSFGLAKLSFLSQGFVVSASTFCTREIFHELKASVSFTFFISSASMLCVVIGSPIGK